MLVTKYASKGNVTISQSYNSLGDLAGYQAKYSGSPIFQTSYTRDSLGRITELRETVEGRSEKKNYTYDIAGRLEKVWRNDTLTSVYSYDANGNRIAHVTQASADSGYYDDQDRMVRYGNAQYVYTANGELQKKIENTDTTHYTYDYFGNLTKVVLRSSDVIEYLIDGQNRRIGKEVNGHLVKRWIYSGLTPVAELDSAGKMTSRFIGDYFIRDGFTYKLIRDNLGSIRIVINVQTGNIVQRLDYDEYGNVITDTNPDFQPFGYVSGLYDTDTKLTRFGCSDYDSKTGRWTIKDPAGFEGADDNFYRYVENDPINCIDPIGLKLWYADKAAQKAFEGNIKEMMKTPAGRKLLKQLHSSPEMYKINAEADPKGRKATAHNNEVWLDPTFHGEITTSTGNVMASTTRQLAHELGHLTGIRDEMENINTWENPVMSPLDKLERTKYETEFTCPAVIVTPN